MPVIARLKVYAIKLRPTHVERAAVVDPQNQRARLGIERVPWIGKKPAYGCFKRSTRGGEKIVRASLGARQTGSGPVGRHQKGETHIRVVERAIVCRSALQEAVDLGDI